MRRLRVSLATTLVSLVTLGIISDAAVGAPAVAAPLAPQSAATGAGLRRWTDTTPDGMVDTPDEQGGVYVLPVEGVPLDLSGRLACDWRDGDVW